MKMINFRIPKLLTMQKKCTRGREIFAKQFLLSTFYFLLFTFSANAQQTWQWGKSGGSSSISSNNNFERVLDIATDKWGNSYFLAVVYQAGMSVDGNLLNGFGNNDAVISSFDCNGNYRWGKVLGTPTSGNDFNHIETDTLGGVYIAGSMFIANMYTAYIDTDTTIANTNKSLMLIKFDTAGIYQWLRMPQADTVSVGSISNTRTLELDVDGGGNIYWLCQLLPGAYVAGTYVVNNSGVYMFRYDEQGIFQSAFTLEMNGAGTALVNVRMKRDHANGRFYVNGYLPTSGDLFLGGGLVTHEMYAAGFNSQGQHLWTQEGTAIGNSRFYARPAVDDSGYVYLAGISNHGDVFAGYNVINTLTTITHAVPFVAKLDSTGILKWANNASVLDNTYCNAMTLRNSNELVVTGSYGYMLDWNGFSGQPLGQGINPGGDLFITRINAHTGAVIENDSLASGGGTSEYPSALATDAGGGVILGGRFPGTLFVGTADTLYNMGGETDFFIAKYGYPCGCIVPVADYTSVINGWNGVFTYSGTTPYDSLRWYFGDGNTSTQTNPSHTYTTDGNYTVCVTAYSPCDSNQYCASIQVAVGVNTIAGIEDISVYPIPATELLQVKGLVETTQYTLLTITGAVLQQGTIEPHNNGISTSELTPGMYLLELSNKQQKGVVRVMKQ